MKARHAVLVLGCVLGLCVGLTAPASATAVAPPSGSYEFLSGTAQSPGRWNPCRTLTWAIVTPQTRAEAPLVASAFRAASSASGIKFQEVSGVPADIVISIVAGRSFHGFGGARSWLLPTGLVLADGHVEAYVLKRGASNQAKKELYMHEIGHVLGLGHVKGKSEIMYPMVDLNRPLTKYGPGDRAGLARLGTSGGCLPEYVPGGPR